MENMTNISSNAVNQNPAFEGQRNNSAETIKQMAVNDLKAIENLVQAGVINEQQGQNIMKYVTEKAFEKYAMYDVMPKSTPAQPVQQKEIPPEFFNKDGRLDVYAYMKNSNVDFDEDEISKISALVEKIEASAVDRYLREKDHEKTLNTENEKAKQRLRANAQNSLSGGLNNLVYTREQIGNMSGAEFAKHERAIMDQLKKGLIK